MDTKPSDQTLYDILRFSAEYFYDIQKSRIATGNKISAGVRLGVVDPTLFAHHMDAYNHNEVDASKVMRKAFRQAVPHLSAWQKEQPGIGEHLLARLIGVIGEPSWAFPHHWEGEGANRKLIEDAPYRRTVSRLWSYCGVGDPTRKRRSGMKAEDALKLGSPHAKMLCRLIAESTMKQVGSLGDDEGKGARRRSKYRDLYDERKESTEDREWTDMHRHNDALRIVSKEILKDLWVVSYGAT